MDLGALFISVMMIVLIAIFAAFAVWVAVSVIKSIRMRKDTRYSVWSARQCAGFSVLGLISGGFSVYLSYYLTTIIDDINFDSLLASLRYEPNVKEALIVGFISGIIISVIFSVIKKRIKERYFD